MTKTYERLTAVAVLLMLLAAGMIFLYAPEDYLQKEPQRIFYLHVSAAIAALATARCASAWASCSDTPVTPRASPQALTRRPNRNCKRWTKFRTLKTNNPWPKEQFRTY